MLESPCHTRKYINQIHLSRFPCVLPSPPSSGTALGGCPSSTMPSLRRTASSPAVRSSPYSNGAVAARGNGHRRSSGSETTSRRVLADIEWWRVSDGQCDPSADQEQEDRTQDIVPLDESIGIHIQSADAGVERQSPLSLPWLSGPTGVSSEVCVRPRH